VSGAAVTADGPGTSGARATPGAAASGLGGSGARTVQGAAPGGPGTNGARATPGTAASPAPSRSTAVPNTAGTAWPAQPADPVGAAEPVAPEDPGETRPEHRWEAAAPVPSPARQHTDDQQEESRGSH
jgi:hypothetical protein